jgi:glycosyltransferase involved in cell wall biosynthesis
MTDNHRWPENLEDIQHGFYGPLKDQPLVSVVIPCYEQAHFLGEAIESVLSQTCPRHEIIVVDDGSTDNTSEVASSYPGIRLVRQENQGLSKARNAGIRSSKGEYLVFLDADDRLIPEALEVGLECLQAHPECAFTSGHCKVIDAGGSPLSSPPQDHVEKDHYVALLRDNYIWMPAMVMYRRWVFESVGGFDARVNAAADYDLYLRVARRFPVHSHDREVAEYRKHGTNMTGNHALMLSTAVSVLRSQRKQVKGIKQYEEAYRSGLRFWRGWYGDPLVDRVRGHLRGREWKQATRGLLVLTRYYPRGLVLLDERRMRRHKLAEQLQARNRELGELKRTLAKERQRVQQLRKQNQSLRLRVQGMDRKLQDIQGSRTWKMLRRISYVRAKVSRK